MPLRNTCFKSERSKTTDCTLRVHLSFLLAVILIPPWRNYGCHPIKNVSQIDLKERLKTLTNGSIRRDVDVTENGFANRELRYSERGNQ